MSIRERRYPSNQRGKAPSPNRAVSGARMALLSRAAWQRASEVAELMTYRDLSADGSFMDEYVGALFLPHTDSDRFPQARAALGVT